MLDFVAIHGAASVGSVFLKKPDGIFGPEGPFGKVFQPVLTRRVIDSRHLYEKAVRKNRKPHVIYVKL